MIEIIQIKTNSPLNNFSYLIDLGDRAFVVDPYYPNQILDFAKERNLKILSIINTHEHQDHFIGNLELKKHIEGEVLVPKNCLRKILGADREVRDLDLIFSEDDFQIKIIETPGHTLNHISILILEAGIIKAIICGDTLFQAGVGNTYSGNSEVLYETIRDKFEVLPDEVLIYCGHDYIKTNLEFTLGLEENNLRAKDIYKRVLRGESIVSNMKLEREINLFLRRDSKTLIRNLKERGFEVSCDKSVFIALRELRNRH